MDTSAQRVAEHQRRALDFMLDTLGLRHEWDEVSRSPETQALVRTVAALDAESGRALGAPLRKCERRDHDREPNDI